MNGTRNAFYSPLRPACRVRSRPSVRLRPGMRYWSHPRSPARAICFLVRRILKFHDSEPLLAGGPPQ